MEEIFKIKGGEIIEEFLGEQLVGEKYEPIFDYFNNLVVCSRFFSCYRRLGKIYGLGVCQFRSQKSVSSAN